MVELKGICYIITLVASVALLVYGFYQIYLPKQFVENDTQVISRQLKGFAFLLLSQLVILISASLCMGSDLLNIVKKFRT